MFDQSSMVVQSWARLIQSGAKAMQDVPALFNLQEMVRAVVEG